MESDDADPVSFEDYQARRTALVEEKMQIQHLLSEINNMAGGGKKNAKRHRVSARYLAVEQELSRLKAWAKQNASRQDAERTKRTVVENAEDRKQQAADTFTAFRKSFADFFEYVKFLEQQVTEQKAEIANLKAELDSVQLKEIEF